MNRCGVISRMLLREKKARCIRGSIVCKLLFKKEEEHCTKETGRIN